MPFIEEILNNIRAIICDLEPHQVHTFYEAVGYMISAQTVSHYIRVISSSLSHSLIQDDVAQKRLIEKYMALPNELWDSIIQRATAVSCSV